MPQLPELASSVLFFASGFLFVQTLSLLGTACEHSGLERSVWSVAVSVPIRWTGMELISLLNLGIEPGLELEIFILGLALGLGLILDLARRVYGFLFAFGGREEEQG